MRVSGRVRLQRGFEALHRLALQGMNIGAAADQPASSGEARVLRGLPTRPVIMDVGANTGTWAILALSNRPQANLHCFEPSAAAYAKLVQRLEGRATAHQFGLGQYEESVTLFAPEPGSVLASYHRRRHPQAQWEPMESVRVRPLDAVVEELGWPRIDLLKVDVEGMNLPSSEGRPRRFVRD